MPTGEYKIHTQSVWILIGTTLGVTAFIYLYYSTWIAKLPTTSYIVVGICLLLIIMAPLYFFGYEYYRKYIIKKLYSQGEYHIATIIKAELRGGNKYRNSYYVWICRDTSNKEYVSEPLKNIESMNIKIGDRIQVYEKAQFPRVYWVDLNKPEKNSGMKDLTNEDMEEGKRIINTLKKNAGKTKILIYPILFILGIATLILGYKCISEFTLLLQGIETKGIITSISTNNSTCSTKRRITHRYACTKFYITITLPDFESKTYKNYKNLLGYIKKDDNLENLEMTHIKYIDNTISLGGVDHPASLIKYKTGQILSLIVKPSELKKDSIFGKIITKNSLESSIKYKSIIFIILLLVLSGSLISFYLDEKKK